MPRFFALEKEALTFKDMKMKLLILLWTISVTGQAQKVKILRGDLAFLKGQTSIKTEFVYDDILVAKDRTEAEYLTMNKEALNKKEAGRGDKWEKAWYDCRKERFEPQFRDRFSKRSTISTVDNTAPYTLIFKAIRFTDVDLLIESGLDAGISHRPSFIDAEALIVETQNHDHVLAKLGLTRIPGGYSSAWTYGGMSGSSVYYEVKVRLGLSYAKAGDLLGEFIATSLNH